MTGRLNVTIFDRIAEIKWNRAVQPHRFAQDVIQFRALLESLQIKSDARQTAGTPEGHRVAVTLQKFICDKWLPFFRFGYADGDASLMQTTFSTGLGLQRENRDVAGVGISWGTPATGAQDQFTSEFFYRFQLTQFLAITPDVQLIVDPAKTPNEDVLGFFGVRARASF